MHPANQRYEFVSRGRQAVTFLTNKPDVYRGGESSTVSEMPNDRPEG